MSFLKSPGAVIVWNPFCISDITRYQTYIGMEGDAGKTVYLDYLQNQYKECFIAVNPYPSYRIPEYDILLKPEPSVCYYNGILWKSDEYSMFINYNGDVVLTRGWVPGEFLAPEESFREMEYWTLTRAHSGTVNEKSLIGKHYQDPAKNITVVKEFPRWVRRDDGVLHRHNIPCGYYDPRDGAEGTLRIGTPLEQVENSAKKYDGKEFPLIVYLGEAMTWKQ